jgi:hypothetical protein
MKTSGFDVYQDYCALKAHFKRPDYDFFKYNGKVKATYEAFERRVDRNFFNKLAKSKTYREQILANIISDDLWIGEIVLNEQATENYKAWRKRRQSLAYTFKQDLAKLDGSLKDQIVIVPGGHPKIVTAYLRNDVCLETVCIVADILKCHGYWDKNITDVIWKDLSLRIRKYTPFVTYDKLKFSQLLRENFSGN